MSIFVVVKMGNYFFPFWQKNTQFEKKLGKIEILPRHFTMIFPVKLLISKSHLAKNTHFEKKIAKIQILPRHFPSEASYQ